MDTNTAEVSSPQNEEAGIEDASTNDLRDALGITEPVPEGMVPESGAAVPEAAESPPQPMDDGQQPTAEAEAERLAKRRIRPRNAKDQQVIDLYRSEAFDGSFADASRIIYDQQSVANANLPPQEAEAPQPDPFDGQVSELHEQIAGLEEEVAKAADELDTGEALKLQREIMKRELQLQQLSSRRERDEEYQQQHAYHTHRTKTVESRDRVYERYPELQNKDTTVRKQFDDFIQQSHNNPDYAAVFDSPRWPELMVNEFIAMHAPPPQQQPYQQQMQVPPQQAPQMGTQARVLTTGTAAQPANAPITEQGVMNQLPNVSTEDLYKLLGSAGGPQPSA